MSGEPEYLGVQKGKKAQWGNPNPAAFADGVKSRLWVSDPLSESEIELRNSLEQRIKLESKDSGIALLCEHSWLLVGRREMTPGEALWWWINMNKSRLNGNPRRHLRDL